MNGKRHPVYTVMFAVGLVLYASGLGVGVYDSLHVSGHLPGLSTDYRTAIHQQLVQGQYEEAMPQLRMALSLDHATEHLAQHGMGMALAAQNKTDEAIVHFQKALAFQPRFADGHFGLAMALAKKGETAQGQGQYAEAREHLERAIFHFKKTLSLQPDHDKAKPYLDVATRLLRQVVEAQTTNAQRP